ncbi:MAG: amidohydrolase family protein [Spirochaetota bacterium]
MIIDCHNHILAAGAYPGYEKFIKEMTVEYFRSIGKLPTDRMPVDDDWKGLEYLWEPIDPQVLIKDHDKAGVDKSVVLGVAPSEYTLYLIRGTIDLRGVTDVPGPPTIEKANDYIAAVVKKYPDKLIGMAAVNPKFRGPEAAVEELERAIHGLKLTGLKLYPCYDHYSPNDWELTYPLFEKAQQLGLLVMVHQSATPVIDAPLKYSRPYLLDDVGRKFRELKIMVCHAGLPWVEETMVMVAKHPNFSMDVSYLTSVYTRREMYYFLKKAQAYGVRWSKICWGTDYPGFEFPETLLPKFRTVNEEARSLGEPEIPEDEIEKMLGDYWLKAAGLKG